MIRFTLGDLRFSILDAGELWLDGGAMFGVVPRPLWERERPPDQRNRIQLAMNILLVQDGSRTVLVDTGAGTKWDDKSRSIYRLRTPAAEQILAPAGLSPSDVDTVVLSHLHFDHGGGNTRWDEGGKAAATFPNAKYVIRKEELETARWDNPRTRASYLPENFEPLVEEDRVELVEGIAEVTPWLKLRPAPGHTPAMQLAVFEAGEGTVAFLADLVPTASHVPYPYIMGYDLEPLVTLATKREVLPKALSDGWYLVFEHDADLPLGRLVEDTGRLKAVAVETE
jgi:glyoxylase-like metal-dependent hydrolase (beta-lactamase superfamily II)